MARSGIVPPTLRLRTFITGPVVTPDFAAEGDTARADIPRTPLGACLTWGVLKFLSQVRAATRATRNKLLGRGFHHETD